MGVSTKSNRARRIRRRALRFLSLRGASAPALVFTIIVLTAIWLAGGAYCLQARSTIYEEAQLELEGAQNVMRAHTGRTYQSAKSLLAVVDDWLANQPRDAGYGSLDRLADLLGRMQQSDADPFAVRLINAADTGVWRLPKPTVLATNYLGDRDYVSKLRDAAPGTIYLGTPVTGRASGKKVLPVGFRARPNALGIKYISAIITEANFSSAFSQLTDVVPSTIGLLGADGTVLFIWPVDEDQKGRVVPQFTDVIAGQAPGSSGVLTLPSMDGLGMSLVGYARLNSDPLAVFAAIKKDDLERLWWHTITIPIMLAVLSTIVVAFLGYWLGHMMHRNAGEAHKLATALAKAEAANESKNHFLTNMSHELRTPLNAIIGFAEIMVAELFGPLGTANYKTYAKDIEGAGRHLLGIISQILDMAKIESGTIADSDASTHLDETAMACIRLLEEKSAQKKVTMVCSPLAELPPLRMNPVHLRQVLLNLLGNAIKFSHDGGRVEIDTQIDADGSLRIVVTDHGIGIKAEHLGDLFKPFVQVEKSLSRLHGGIGLGLVNTRRIVEAYGGRVWLESDYGQGTQAIALIPANRLIR